MPSTTTRTAALFERNRRVIPGGIVSLNRAMHVDLAFERAQGSTIWDVEGNAYVDFNLAFAPFILGHNDPRVNAAVIEAIQSDRSLFGAGTTPWEGDLAERLVQVLPSVDKVQLTNTGSEATYHALRIARAHTGRDDVVIMQGGYNGWHNDVAANIMTPAEVLGPRVSPGTYPFAPTTAGVPADIAHHVHVVNYNDLDSIAYVFRRHRVACVILEPVLQNIGVVKPQPGYLEGLRTLCDEHGVVLVFDEVKTGFRHGLGGYQAKCGVMPDLCTFGKAVSNGYPMGAIGGRAELMDYFIHDDATKRVLIAGTYNAHPVACAAALATLDALAEDDGAVYRRLETLGQTLEDGLANAFAAAGVSATVSREGSAFCVYFMDHAPVDWHDLLEHHDTALDLAWRRDGITRGVFQFPLAMKQGSLSAAHDAHDVSRLIEATEAFLAARPARA